VQPFFWGEVVGFMTDVVSGSTLKVPIKHHHIHFVAHSHMALRVAQHDQAIGLHHGAEHARALVAGDAHLQLARRVGADDAALVLGAAWFFAQGLRAFGLEQRQGRRTKAAKVTITATGLPGNPNRAAGR